MDFKAKAKKIYGETMGHGLSGTHQIIEQALLEAYKEGEANGSVSKRRDRFLKRLRQCVKEYPCPPKEPIEAFLVWTEARIRTMEAEALALREGK